MWSQFFYTVLRPGELQDSYQKSCKPSLINVWERTKNRDRELCTRTEQECTPAEIARGKWNWIGHTLRKPTSDTTRQAQEWNLQGKTKVGRPVKTWRRSEEEELKEANIIWNNAKRTAANRIRWRSIVTDLSSTRHIIRWPRKTNKQAIQLERDSWDYPGFWTFFEIWNANNVI